MRAFAVHIVNPLFDVRAGLQSRPQAVYPYPQRRIHKGVKHIRLCLQDALRPAPHNHRVSRVIRLLDIFRERSAITSGSKHFSSAKGHSRRHRCPRIACRLIAPSQLSTCSSKPAHHARSPPSRHRQSRSINALSSNFHPSRFAIDCAIRPPPLPNSRETVNTLYSIERLLDPPNTTTYSRHSPPAVTQRTANPRFLADEKRAFGFEIESAGEAGACR